MIKKQKLNQFYFNAFWAVYFYCYSHREIDFGKQK